ncbi:MAG: hypothetical protein U1E10_15355 [Bdellovibrionales bacterium]|nr:hypothetical protein [Bdellovibrionales bacterium]
MISRRHTIFWWALVALFLFPYVFSLLISSGALRLPADFFELCMRSFSQALVSTLLTIVLGILGAAFLVKSASNARRLSWWEGLALLPSIAPSSAMVFGFMDLFPNFRGVWAVTAAHALISMGFVSVILSRAIRERIGASLELAWVEGASQWMMWRRAILPSLKSDFFAVFVTIFFSSLASFSVPLLLGGSQAVTFETAIHYAIRLENAWDIAAALSIFQLALLVSAVALVRFGRQDEAVFLRHIARHKESVSRAGIGRVVGSFTGLPVVVFGSAVVLFSILRHPFEGWAQLKTSGLLETTDTLWLALQGGLATSTLAGVLTSSLLMIFAFTYPSDSKMRWMSAYVAPSTAITGFATLAIGWGQAPSFFWDVLRIAVGAAFLFAPVLWRLRWETELRQMNGQIQVARTLGANHKLISLRVLLPQLWPTFFWSGGLVSFWMWGDYALGSIAASRSMTIGMLAKSLMESYRLEAASLVLAFSLVAGAISYRLFTLGGVRVGR